MPAETNSHQGRASSLFVSIGNRVPGANFTPVHNTKREKKEKKRERREEKERRESEREQESEEEHYEFIQTRFNKT